MAGIFTAFEISSSGLTVQRKKMDTISENIANVDTVKAKDGQPYRRQRVVVNEDRQKTPFRTEFGRARDILTKTNPKHLDAVTHRSGQAQELSHVEAEAVADPASNFRLVFDPGHPDADAEGYVKMPDVEIVNEMVDMIAASRTYEANIAAISAVKKMMGDAIDI